MDPILIQSHAVKVDLQQPAVLQLEETFALVFLCSPVYELA